MQLPASTPLKPVVMPAGLRKQPIIYKLIADLQDQRDDYHEALQMYGDHTVDCYWAQTDRCTCGWRLRRKQFGIRPNVGSF